jgi:hypothetical protein
MVLPVPGSGFRAVFGLRASVNGPQPGPKLPWLSALQFATGFDPITLADWDVYQESKTQICFVFGFWSVFGQSWARARLEKCYTSQQQLPRETKSQAIS